MLAPPLHNLPRGVKRSRSEPGEWDYPEEWGADAGPAKVPLGKCTAQWMAMLEEAISVFGPPLLALCKPIVQIPKAFIRYEHKFCGENFVGERDNSMKFIVEARRVLNAPGSTLTYTFTVKMSLGKFREEYATQLLHNRLVKKKIDHTQQVSLDAWRKKWQEQRQEQRALQMSEEKLEPLLAGEIRKKLTIVLSPWLQFFHDHFTYEEDKKRNLV